MKGAQIKYRKQQRPMSVYTWQGRRIVVYLRGGKTKWMNVFLPEGANERNNNSMEGVKNRLLTNKTYDNGQVKKGEMPRYSWSKYGNR